VEKTLETEEHAVSLSYISINLMANENIQSYLGICGKPKTLRPITMTLNAENTQCNVPSDHF
jgi:hypothetical protein